MEYKFNIYRSLRRAADGKASFKRNTSGAALRRCEGARKFVRARGDEWLYKLAVPYQPFKRGSRINLIWRVARFVFEGPGLRPTESLRDTGVMVASQSWFSLSRLPSRATKTTRPDVTMPPPSASLPLFRALIRRQRPPRSLFTKC